MAPERFFGAPTSALSDVYELAVVLYAMLVGRLPWDEAGDAEGRLLPLRPRDAGVELPGDLESVVLRALATRPELRPSSARSFASEARAAVARAPVARHTGEQRPSAQPRAQERARGGRRVLYGVIAAAALAVVVVVALLVVLRPGRRTSSGAASGPASSASPPPSAPPPSAAAAASPTASDAALLPSALPSRAPTPRPATPSGAGPLAICRKVVSLVCKAPDSTQCATWRADYARWQDFPPDAQATVAAGCRDYYPRALANERERARWQKGQD